MLRNSISFRVGVCVVTALAFGGCDPDVSSTSVNVEYNSTAQRVNVLLGRELSSGETLHSRVRRGTVDELDCASDSAGIERIDAARVSSAATPTFQGPEMTPSDFESPYQSTAWFEGEPTPEMLAMIADGGLVIDVCWMASNGTVVREAAFDARRALDRRGQNGKFDGEEARIRSTVAYAERCEEVLGENPFFPAIEGSEGDYETYNCLDSVPIPTNVTDADGNTTQPSQSVTECDHPQYIYSSCEPSATNPGVNGPRVASRTNDRGTHWVLLCRKAHEAEGQYNDIAMIGANPFTGETCFFQNALYDQTDGLHVPHPADTVESERSPQQSASLWEGIHGGLGSGIECAECHSTDPFIHTPWIDGALDGNGDPVVPMMGVNTDWALGFNDQPYHLVNADGQGWTMPEQLVSEEAAACTRCHRVANDRWSGSWIARQMGDEPSWTNITTDWGQQFEHRVWMPPGGGEGLSEETFRDSEYGRAIAFIQNCAQNPSDAGCIWQPVPTTTGDDDGSLPTIDLEGRELATAALVALGAGIQDPSCPDGDCFTRRCNECHAVTRGGINRWAEFTRHAWDTCGVTDGAVDLNQAILDLANMADVGTLDNEAGLRSDTAAAIVAGRPYATIEALDAVAGVGGASLQKLSDYATQAPQHISPEAAQRTIDCLRSDPSDPTSVFAAENLGVLTISVQYSYFRRLFQAAYGDDWLIEYTRFKTRVSMPKGSHPAMSQQEAATVIEWFRQGLPNLNDVLQEVPPPSTCDETFNTSLINAHVSNMEFEGWGAINEDNGIRMVGCTPGADPLTCFQDGDYPDRSSAWGNDYGTVRELLELGFRSSFWMRTSPDGRWVGNGGGSDGRRSTMTDMLSSPRRDVGIEAAYDPGFFPDNSGWMFQGASGGAGICTNAVLENDDSIDFKEPGCITARGINLYQHVARGLNGGDYFIINGQFTSNGGRSESESPRAPWGASAEIKMTPMIFNGTTYEPQPPLVIDSPYEGDSVLSPSGQLVASRLAGPESRSLGYSVRRVNTNRIGDQYTITLDPPMATICTEGAKPNFSFDERFIVTHIHAGDEADLVLFDLVSGQTQIITSMPDQTRALFPHFRSDGWIYFLVIDEQSGREYVGASDAALVMAAG